MSRAAAWRPAPFVVGLALVLVGFALRARMLRGGNLGFDGGLAVALAASPLRDLLDLSARDVHPPLYYLLLALWWRVAGPGIAPALWPSLALGVVGIAAAWRLGRVVDSLGTPLAVAGLLALAPLAVFDGMAARDFAVLVPAALLSTFVLLRVVECRGAGGRRGIVPLGALYLVGLLSSYYFALTVAAHAALVLWRGRARAAWLAAVAPGGLLLAGWAALSWVRIGATVLGGARPTQSEPPPFPELLSELLQGVVGGSALPHGIGAAGAWASVAAWGAALTFVPFVRLRAEREAPPRAVADLWLVALVGFELTLLGTALVVTLWLRDVAPARYALVILPWAVLLAGLGIAVAASTSRFLGPLYGVFALGPLLLGLWAGWRPVELPKQFWDPRGLVAFLDGDARPDDRVVFISLEQSGYYAALSRTRRPWRIIPIGPRYLEGDLAAETAAKLDPLVGTPGRVRLVLYQGGIAPENRIVRDRLDALAYPSAETRLADSVVLDAVVPPPGTRELEVRGGRYERAALARATLAGDAAPGGLVGLQLEWRAEGPLPGSYSVFVHLLDGRGEKIGQHDAGPADGARQTNTWQSGETVVDRHGLIVPADSRGPYALLVGLYDQAGRLLTEDGADAVRIPVG
jgi:hypothetical protein